MSSQQFDASDDLDLFNDKFDESTPTEQDEEFDFSDIAQEVEPTEPEETPAPVADDFLPHPIGGTMLLAIGCALLIAGVGFATWTVLSPKLAPQSFLNLGVTPFSVIATAMILIAMSSLRRQQDHVGNRTDAYVAPMHEMLAYIAQRAEGRVEREEIERTMIAIQRLDEKIQNLSRATKMYGKPLVDVANQMQEAANHLQEIEGSLDGVVEKVESSSRRLGEDLSKLIGATGSDDNIPIEQFDNLVAATRKSANILAELKLDLETAPDPTQPMDALQQSLDAIRTELAELKHELANAKSDDHALDGLQQAVASILGEVGQLSNAIATLERAPEPAAPTAPKTSKASKAKAPAQPTAAADGDGAAANDAKSGLAQSIAGERKGKGKNVLGAIAKLRQMRN